MKIQDAAAAALALWLAWQVLEAADQVDQLASLTPKIETAPIPKVGPDVDEILTRLQTSRKKENQNGSK
jgi:hypothetical protein